MSYQRSNVSLFLAVGILILGFFLRVIAINSGLSDICLLNQEEHWLYEEKQVSSVFAWDTNGVKLYVAEGKRIIAPTSADLVFLRYVGVLAGILVLALTRTIARLLGFRYPLLMALVVATVPLIVLPDQWLIRFDLATLGVAVSAYCLLIEKQSPQKKWAVLRIGFAASLLLIAPPLWWIAVLLLSVDFYRHWRVVAFAIVTLLILFPALRNAEAWLSAAQMWDIGVVSALAWLLLMSGVWYFKQPSSLVQLTVFGVCVASTFAIIFQTLQRPNPSTSDWVIIRALQNAIPQNSRVELPVSWLPFAPVIACPLGANLTFEAVAPEQNLITRTNLPVSISLVEGTPTSQGHHQPLDERYTLVRHMDVQNPIVLPLRDQMVVLGSQLLTAELQQERMLDIRLDFQMTNALTEQLSVYGLFVHLTQIGQPAEKVLEYGFPFGQELGTVQPREMFLNYHVRVRIPSTVPSGTYDVVVGFVHNIEVKEMGRLVVGQVTIQ